MINKNLHNYKLIFETNYQLKKSLNVTKKHTYCITNCYANESRSYNLQLRICRYILRTHTLFLEIFTDSTNIGYHANSLQKVLDKKIHDMALRKKHRFSIIEGNRGRQTFVVGKRLFVVRIWSGPVAG